MLQKIKAAIRAIERGKPGGRFIDHYERSRKDGHGSSWKTVGYVSAGAVLLICGLVLSLPPGVPGFLLWIPGLGLIASRSRRFSNLLDRLELWARQVWRSVRARFR